jgi:hypothetical protein
MKWLAAGLTFFNVSTMAALLIGLMADGLSRGVARLAILAGIAGAIAAYRLTSDSEPPRPQAIAGPAPEELPGRRRRRRAKEAEVIVPARERYRSIWFWLLAFCFAVFAVRSFAWLLYYDGNELKVQSPNNLGDLSLHLTYIKQFASGIPLWPDNPIHPFSKLRYPAGVDLFNAIFTALGVEVTRSLVWTGLLGSVVTCYAFYRWAGTFGIAAFLFNGGVAGFPVLKTFAFLDYQGVPSIAWKSLPLAMFVTQRGLLYALPVGLLLLYQWRAKFFPEYVEPARLRAEERTDNTGSGERRAPLPLWLELSFYATLPLYHAHTFMALSVVLAFLFVLGNKGGRRHAITLVLLAVLPATFCVWITTDYFHASSFIKWQPGWVQQQGDFAMPFIQFWIVNFGAWVPVVLFFIGITAWNVWKQARTPTFRITASVAFLIPVIAIFLVGYLIKLAPWEWDNIKIIVWAYIVILPFLWTDLMVHWSLPLRVIVCVALFFSGFVTLLGGLAAGRTGFGIADRTELDAVGAVVKKLPIEARYAGFPTYNHPVLLQGRKMVLGYPGHLWTQGFDYGPVMEKLQALMQGAPNWKEIARSLKARYLFWGREEKLNYTTSRRPWEREATLVAGGDWGAIYDLETARPQTVPAPAPSQPVRAVTASPSVAVSTPSPTPSEPVPTSTLTPSQ